MAPSLSRALDGVAVSLSSLCLIHCLVLPVAAVALPVLGIFAQAEWVHWVFVGFALPITITMLVRLGRARAHRKIFLFALIGLSGLLAGAAGWPTHDLETVLTVIGGLALASAHVLNWQRSNHAH